MKRRLQRWLPHPDVVRKSRWAGWFGPMLHHPRLWYLNRRGIARGFAIGIFFGLLIPVGQIPISGAVAIAVRVNVPVAMAATFISNPVTFGPIYYAAYKLGRAVVGADQAPPPPGFDDHGAWPDPTQVIEPPWMEADVGFFRGLWLRLEAMGKPLLVGLAIIATAGGLIANLLVNALWRLNARLAWRRRIRERRERRERAIRASLFEPERREPDSG